jgi:hypothetical protein
MVVTFMEASITTPLMTFLIAALEAAAAAFVVAAAVVTADFVAGACVFACVVSAAFVPAADDAACTFVAAAAAFVVCVAAFPPHPAITATAANRITAAVKIFFMFFLPMARFSP